MCGGSVHNWGVEEEFSDGYQPDEDEDDFDEEAEAGERYPFLHDDEADDAEPAAENRHDETDAAVSVFARCPNDQADDADNALVRNEYDQVDGRSTLVSDDEIDEPPNYHYIDRLTDDLLPSLNFYRYDNLFEGRPARAFFGERQNRQCVRLFGNHWRAGEMAILFGDTGSGKSILAVQIAQSIASGFQFGPFALNAPPQRVVYFDLELTDAQFERRYSAADETHPAQFPFHINFIRCPPREYGEMPRDFRDYTEWLTASMVDFIEFSAARVVIIDNITWLNNSSQIGNSAARVMKALHRLKKRLGISILVIAHTPKRPIHTVLNINDMQGSIMLATFADGVFALGTSRKASDMRYVKAIKHRSSAARSTASEVSVLRLVKDQCFLGFEFVGMADENEYATRLKGNAPERLHLFRQVDELSEKGQSQRTIAETLGVSSATVNRCLKRSKSEAFHET